MNKGIFYMGKLYDAYVKSYALSAENAPEFFEIVNDIYLTPEFQSMSKFIQHADITRLQHIMSVAYLSFLDAKARKKNYKAAARGAMLHDLFYYDWHERGDGSHRLHGYRHPGFALKNAKELFTLSETEENIILRHMWPLTPTPPKYSESLTVSLADKYCASQEILIKKFPSYRRKFLSDVEKAGGEA